MLFKNESGQWTYKKETVEEYCQRVWKQNNGGEPDSFQKRLLEISLNDDLFEPDNGSDEGYMHIAHIDEIDEDGYFHRKMLNLAKVILCSYALVCYDRSTKCPFDPNFEFSMNFYHLANKLNHLIKEIDLKNEGYF